MNIKQIFSSVMSSTSGAGSIRMTCHCGRTHFTSRCDDFELGEYEELCKLQEENPNDYICHDGYVDYVCGRNFDGREYVMDCPCNWEERGAAFIWNNREIIIKMLIKCRNEKIDEAIQIDKLMEGIK